MPIEQQIAQLVYQFHNAAPQFFHERELHAIFFGLCRNSFPQENTNDSYQVHLLRHEYETVWKYAKRDPEPYTERLSDRGTTACFDFTILRQDFVQAHDLLTVINKNEKLRRSLRRNPFNDAGVSEVIDVGIEFKMAHRRHQMAIAQGQVNALKSGMRLDARKLAMERVRIGYLLAFSHGPLPAQNCAENILGAVFDEHARRRNGFEAVQLRGLIATPQHTFLAGGWIDPKSFPNPHAV